MAITTRSSIKVKPCRDGPRTSRACKAGSFGPSVQFVARAPMDCGEDNGPNHDRTESREPGQALLIA